MIKNNFQLYLSSVDNMWGYQRAMVQKVSLLSLPVSLSPSIQTSLQVISDALTHRTGLSVTFINPHAFYLSTVDQGYANCLWHFDLVLADGIGVAKAVRWVTGRSIQRQSFDATSLFRPFFERLHKGQRSLAIIGGRSGVADIALAKMRQSFPEIRFVGAQHGFHQFDDLVTWILEKKPEVVLIGMGAPFQEKLLLRLRHSGFRGLCVTCGGFLDQYVQKEKYYPYYVDALNLRFLYRLVKEPKRLARRYLIEYQSFVFSFIQSMFAKLVLGR